MNHAKTIREQLAFAVKRCEYIQLACREAETAIRAKNEQRLRLYIACAEGERLRLQIALRRACDALNKMPLDGLLEESLARIKRKCFQVTADGKKPCQLETGRAEGVKS